MASIATLREKLALNLATIPGLRTSAFLPDNPSPPIAIVMPSTINYDDVFKRGMQIYTFNVLVIWVVRLQVYQSLLITLKH